MNKTEQEIKKYMLHNIQDNIDPLTGEINDTSLAEDALWYFVTCENEQDEQIIFDLAHNVASQYEKQHNL